ncbi:MAG: hypothetical protein IAE79_02935 [Anaerolinea sp.]|nr:hypothetical protein [Anaerolinea sp.]
MTADNTEITHDRPRGRIDQHELRQLLIGSVLILLLLVATVSASSGSDSSDPWYRLDVYSDHSHISPVHTTVAIGSWHTCALTNSARMKCWGYNAHGRLGDGTTIDRHTPVDVATVSSAISMGGGWGHTCALMSWGGVQCWGHNGYGQVGNNSAQNQYTPANVVGLYTGAVHLSASLWHSCAVTNTGGVKCWGAGENGRLGDGTEEVRRVPVDVVGLSSGVAAVGAGGQHSCALLHTGAIKCWGMNAFGSVGDGSTIHERLTPVDVVNLNGRAEAISVGGLHSCALMEDGSIRCWGDNRHGQLGDGTTTNRNVPVTVLANGKTFTAVAAGGGHTCALTDERLAQCWGHNGNGQLGDDTTIDHHTPAYVIGLDNNVSEIEAGDWRTCARMFGGALKCWGGNTYGTIGDGTTIERWLPTDVVGFRANLLINYPNGAPGSYFAVTGSLFPPNDATTISANGHVLGVVSTDSLGDLTFQLTTASADDGFYAIQAAGNPRVTTHFMLDAAAPFHPQSGSGMLITVPAGIALTEFAFLPVTMR